MRIEAFVAVVSILSIVFAPAVLGENENEMAYSWDFGGEHFMLRILINGTLKPEAKDLGSVWLLTLSIPYADYEFYHSYPAGYRIGDNYSYLSYFLTPTDTYIRELAHLLDNVARDNGWNSLTEANFILSFVQSVPYVSDFKSTGFLDYYKFPVETLLQRGGDCEDKSLLLATLLNLLGYDVILFVMEIVYGGTYGHVSVGLDVRDPQGPFALYLRDYYVYNHTRYYYIESTGSDSTIVDGGAIRNVHYWVGISPEEAGAVIKNLTFVPLSGPHYSGYVQRYHYVKEMSESNGFNWYFGYMALLSVAFLSIFFYSLRREKKTCPRCSYPLENDFEYCPNCGFWVGKK